MDREAWHAVIPGVAKSWTQLSGWTTTTSCIFPVPVLEYWLSFNNYFKCIWSMILCVCHWLNGHEFRSVNSRSWWWTGRPGMLQSMGSQRVGHDWATELNWFTPDTQTLLSEPESRMWKNWASEVCPVASWSLREIGSVLRVPSCCRGFSTAQVSVIAYYQGH